MQDKKVSEFTRRRDPVTLPPQASVQEACARMREQRVGAVLVVAEDGRLLGIFTGRDAVCRILSTGTDPRPLRLEEVMTHDPATLPPESGALEALRLMQDGGFRHLPIVDAQGKVCGVVSRGDFRALQHARLDEETGFFETLR
jgi:CBS domain-containing protein